MVKANLIKQLIFCNLVFCWTHHAKIASPKVFYCIYTPILLVFKISTLWDVQIKVFILHFTNLFYFHYCKHGSIIYFMCNMLIVVTLDFFFCICQVNKKLLINL